MKPTVLRLNTPLLSPQKAHFASTTLSIYISGLKFILKKKMNNYTRHITVNDCFTTNLQTAKQ